MSGDVLDETPPLLTSDEVIAVWPRPVERARQPFLVVMGGLPASGKSTFARALTAEVAIAHLAADEVRQLLTGGRPTYAGDENYRVHATNARLAQTLLGEGYHVLLDATNIKPRDRRRSLELALPVGAATILVWCEVEPAEAERRLAVRAARLDPDDYSQADADVRARMAAITTAPTPAEAGTFYLVGPDAEAACLAALVAQLEQALDDPA